MGIIRAAVQSVKSGFRDQWLESIEPADMGEQTLLTHGVMQSRKGQNKKGTRDVITDGSVIHVYENQMMILTDGGRILDYSAEPGYYVVDNKAAPSLFNGDFSAALEETFERVKFGGHPAGAQKVYYLNLQEIRGIKFGTMNPINYFDSFYNAELFLRAFGTYSIRLTDPLKFYAEVAPRNKDQVEAADIAEQFKNEFMEALQASINQMSADGIRISFVSSKGRELSKYMSDVLDEEWHKNRGVSVESVGIGSISYDEESKALINMRNKGAMLGDPSVREGYMQGAVARGMEAAGSNSGGSMTGFMGMNMAGQMAGSAMSAASAANLHQMEQQRQAGAQAQQQQSAAGSWTCSCGAVNTGNFCPKCGNAAPSASWTCSCGSVNTENFCPNCGKRR